MADLTAKQRAFVQEYLVDLNATQAAIRAGFSVKTAHVQSAQLMDKPGVKAAVDAAMAGRRRSIWALRSGPASSRT